MKNLLASLTRRIVDVRSATWLLGSAALWLLFTVGLRPLMLPDEGRYAGVAWEMLSSGNWLLPTLDGMPFFHKPPLFYWLSELCMLVLGVNEWSARLPSTGAAIAAMVALYFFVRKYADQATANLSVVVLVTQPFLFAGAQFANLDMLVASMIALTILAGADAVLSLERQQPYRISLTACYGFAALGILAKGLIGIVLPGTILLLWLLWRRQYRLIPALLSPPLILLFFVLASPWFLLMQQSFADFLDYFFVYQHFRRFAEGGFNNQQPFWFYLPVLLVFTLPWSPWMLRACSRHYLADPASAGIRSLMLLWTLGIIAFFSLPKSKLVGYILPALPAVAFMIAEQVQGWLRSSNNASAPAWVGGTVVTACVACLVLVLGVARIPQSGINEFAQQSNQFKADDQLVMLDEYGYDMPFYLKATRNPWVVSDWLNPQVPKTDNWRKELYDAGQFNPDAMKENLISAKEFTERLCLRPVTVVWVWGNNETAAVFPFLDEQHRQFANKKHESLWRLDASDRQQLRLCGETPSND